MTLLRLHKWGIGGWHMWWRFAAGHLHLNHFPGLGPLTRLVRTAVQTAALGVVVRIEGRVGICVFVKLALHVNWVPRPKAV
jgi:hypothetical protein